LGEITESKEVGEVGLGVEGMGALKGSKGNASRTDLESVKEEERNEDGEGQTKEGNEEEDETRTETEEVTEVKEKEEQGQQGEGEATATPKVSLSHDEEKPRISNGEKITTCVSVFGSIAVLT
jgi:hypothetical protein